MSQDEFPSTRFQRGKIFAKTGLNVGSGYVKELIRKSVNAEADTSQIRKETADKVFTDFTKLRGTALKLAQTMSLDQSFLPEEFTDIMAKAQYSVPPINKALIRSILKRELGDTPEYLFASFNEQALAAASIGQVHRATLKDGRDVVVKVQYPGVRDSIDSDLALARSLFKRIIKKGSDIDPYFAEVRNTLLMETDYIHEGQEMERFHERFSSENMITPRWIRDYSTSRVLTMTYIEGEHLNDFLLRNPSQEERDHFGQLLWDFFHDQIHENREIHADTHPGNFLFTPDGRLGVLDFGCVKVFPEEFFRHYLALLPTHMEKDEKKILELYRWLGVVTGDPTLDEYERKYLEFSMKYGYAFVEPYETDIFDFGNPEYIQKLKEYTRDAPFSNEPRGNENFIYSTRVHIGLYHMLMKMKARVNTTHSKEIVMKSIESANVTEQPLII